MKNNAMLGFAAIIIALSFSYYFVWFLPTEAKNKLELEKQKMESESSKGAQYYLDQVKLDDCLEAAEDNQLFNWNKMCKDRGLKDDCKLPSDIVTRIEQQEKDDRETCFRRYQR